MFPEISDPDYQVKTRILEALYEVSDPELNINIVDLGLVYGLQLHHETREIIIEMTLSTRSCPLGGLITSHVKLAAEGALSGYTATVNLVWEPKWNADRISDAGKAALGW